MEPGTTWTTTDTSLRDYVQCIVAFRMLTGELTPSVAHELHRLAEALTVIGCVSRGVDGEVDAIQEPVGRVTA